MRLVLGDTCICGWYETSTEGILVPVVNMRLVLREYFCTCGSDLVL